MRIFGISLPRILSHEHYRMWASADGVSAYYLRRPAETHDVWPDALHQPIIRPTLFEQFRATTPWIVPETRNSMSPLSPVLWPYLARCAPGKGRVASEGSNHAD